MLKCETETSNETSKKQIREKAKEELDNLLQNLFVILEKKISNLQVDDYFAYSNTY